MTNDQVARAFSGHRFDEAQDHLADGVVWVLVWARRVFRVERP